MKTNRRACHFGRSHGNPWTSLLWSNWLGSGVKHACVLPAKHKERHHECSCGAQSSWEFQDPDDLIANREEKADRQSEIMRARKWARGPRA